MVDPNDKPNCQGDCCVSFRLPFTHDQLERGDVGEMDAEEARLLAAIFEPISVRRANARQAHLVKGTPQTVVSQFESDALGAGHKDPR